jgi:glycosyltransferase involved in cell wall biosynthesis
LTGSPSGLNSFTTINQTVRLGLVFLRYVNRNSSLTILQMAPIDLAISSNLAYGPIERLVYFLDKFYSGNGHNSIVACSGDSEVVGEKYSTIDKPVGAHLDRHTEDYVRKFEEHHDRTVERVMEGGVDVVHTHIVPKRLIEGFERSSGRTVLPVVYTLHIQTEHPKILELLRFYDPDECGVYFAAISRDQAEKAKRLCGINVRDVVYNGLDVADYPLGVGKGGYLFSMGRITPDKGQHLAIGAAKKAGKTLVLAGNVQEKEMDKRYFRESVEPLIELRADAGGNTEWDDYYTRTIKPLLDSGKSVIFVGPLNDGQKKEWYRHAEAFLMPIQWDEPFGMVMIESMACGTPVVVFGRGSAREIVEDGKTGFVVSDLDGMVRSIDLVKYIDPEECRRRVGSNFTSDIMANKYLELYEDVIDDFRTREIRKKSGDHAFIRI